MSILMSILSSDGYIILNKYIMKALGLHEAILLGELCSEYIYWHKEDKFNQDILKGKEYITDEELEKLDYEEVNYLQNVIEDEMEML